MNFFSRYANPELVTVKLLNILGINVAADEVVEELHTHPDYPNLLAINDVLNNYGADANAYRITADDLADVPCPFIAHTTKPGAEFMLVTAFTPASVKITGEESLSPDEFRKIFDGVVLVPGDDKPVSSPASSKKFNFDTIRYPLAAVMAALVLLVLGFVAGQNIGSWQAILALILKTAGVAVSVLLLIQSIDKNNPLVQTLCSGNGKTNCNAILSSKAANVVEGLTWSDVGFFYFAGTWLAFLLTGAASMQIFAVLNLLCLPYTVYSIYYQARVAKQWCLFCCAIQGLLWLEFIPLVTTFSTPFVTPNGAEILRLVIGLLLPALAWLLLKPVFQKIQRYTAVREQLRTFKYDAEVFNKLLTAQPKYAAPHEDWSIVLGNVEASNIITMVSNPYCPPCSKAHSTLEDWISRDMDVQVRVVFAVNNVDGDSKTQAARHLMALNEAGDSIITRKALHDWYEQKQKDYTKWAQAYPVTFDATKYDKLQKQHDWCNIAEVKATPTILLNGHVLPEKYRLQDIKYLLMQQ